LKQLLLDFQPAPVPSLVNFVVGRNQELIDALRTLPLAEQGAASLYVWGETGSGKTHLLKAAIALYLSRGLNAAYVDDVTDWSRLSAYDAVAVDNVQNLDEDGQIGLFNLFNEFRDAGRPLIVAGLGAPQALEVRPDLRTRLGWGLVYQVQALSDDEKSQALQRHASERGFRLPQEVVDYLLAHVRRDLPTLMGMLDALDKWSLTAKKPVTVSLLKQLLQPSSSLTH
jgi:DnaA family protein